MSSHTDILRCSFCGKSSDDVKKLISGPSVRICNECVAICDVLLADDQAAETQNEDTESVALQGQSQQTSGTAEWVACPACGVPLVLNLRVMESVEVKFPSAGEPKIEGENL